MTMLVRLFFIINEYEEYKRQQDKFQHFKKHKLIINLKYKKNCSVLKKRAGNVITASNTISLI